MSAVLQPSLIDEAANEPDPADPRVWWRMLVDGVAGLRLGNMQPAVTYLRFVEKHRNRDVANAAAKQMRALTKEPGWQDVTRWPGWGYAVKDPGTPAHLKPTARKRR